MRRIVLTALLLAAAPAAGRAGQGPNVIILLADDLGCGDLGCYGAGDVRTPHIDALAAAGIRMTSYYAPAPICAPSRAAMLTGRYPSRAGMSALRNVPSGMNEPGMPAGEVTVAELARRRGYATGVFGKWHLGSTGDTRPNAQGFDLFVGHHASCIDSWSHLYYASEPWYHDLYRDDREIFEDGVFLTDLITRETLAFIDAQRDRPFLAYVAYNVPHYPCTAPARFMQRYAELPEPRRTHVAMVAAMDESVGAIIGHLRERGMLERTLVIFASDNGAASLSKRGEGGGSNAPYRDYKRSLFEGGIRVPGIVAWPGRLPAGVLRDEPAIGMDVLPTVAEAIAAPLPEDRVIDGRSWLESAGRPAPASQPRRLFFEWDGQLAVRDGRWKLVHQGLVYDPAGGGTRVRRLAGRDALFLSDLSADPGETVNLRDQHAEQCALLLEACRAWRDSLRADPAASRSPEDEPSPPGAASRQDPS